MSRVLFLQDHDLEHIGVMYLAGSLKAAGHEVAVRMVRNPQAIRRAVRDFRPRIAAFSAYSGGLPFILAAAKAVKETAPEILTLIGGPGATFSPELAGRPELDALCRGEGEQAVTALAAAHAQGADYTRIPNLTTREAGEVRINHLAPLIADLDELPPAALDLYRATPGFPRRPYIRYQASRGCPFACYFCHNHALRKLYSGLGSYYRRHSPARVVEDLSRLYRRYPFRTVIFECEVFTRDKAWLFELLPALRQAIPLRFICNTSPAYADEETIRLLAQSGCVLIRTGVESGDERFRNFNHNKPVADEELKRLAGDARRHGLKLLTNNIFAAPGETYPQALATWRFNRELKADVPWSSLYTPYPNSAYRGTDGEVHQVELDPLTPSHTFFRLPAMPEPEQLPLLRLHHLFYPAVKFPEWEPLWQTLARHAPSWVTWESIYLLSSFFRYTQAHDLNYADTVRELKHLTRFYWGGRVSR